MNKILNEILGKCYNFSYFSKNINNFKEYWKIYQNKV